MNDGNDDSSDSGDDGGGDCDGGGSDSGGRNSCGGGGRMAVAVAIVIAIVATIETIISKTVRIETNNSDNQIHETMNMHYLRKYITRIKIT